MRIPVFSDLSVTQYQSDKVKASEESYLALSEKLAQYEGFLIRFEKFSRFVLSCLKAVAIAAIVCGIWSAITFLLGKMGLTYLPVEAVATSLFTAFMCLVFSTIGILIVGNGIHELIASDGKILTRRKRFLELAHECAMVRWTKLELEAYEQRYGVIPQAAFDLKLRIIESLPDAAFEVEFTEPTQMVQVKSTVWATIQRVWQPDPFLVVSYGGYSFRIYAWDENGVELKSIEA